jgi:hypothetical protein
MAKKKPLEFASYSELNRLPTGKELRWQVRQHQAAIWHSLEPQAGSLQEAEPLQATHHAAQRHRPGPSSQVFVRAAPYQHWQHHVAVRSQEEAERLQASEPHQFTSPVAQQHPFGPSQVSFWDGPAQRYRPGPASRAFTRGEPTQVHPPRRRRRVDATRSLQGDITPCFTGGDIVNESTLSIDESSVVPSIAPEAGQFPVPGPDAGGAGEESSEGATAEPTYDSLEEHLGALLSEFNATH